MIALVSTVEGKNSSSGMRAAAFSVAFAGLVSLAACGPSQAAPKKGNASTTVRAPEYAIAGLRTGMTAAQIVSAARASGYAIAREETGPDWDLAMQRASGAKNFEFGVPMKGIREQTLRRGGETIIVGYVPYPAGPVAWSIHYSAAPAALSYSAAVAELTKRYGKSTFGNSVASPWAQWCSRPASSARACLTTRYLSVGDSNNGVSIVTADETIRAKQKAEMQRQGAGRASF